MSVEEKYTQLSKIYAELKAKKFISTIKGLPQEQIQCEKLHKINCERNETLVELIKLHIGNDPNKRVRELLQVQRRINQLKEELACERRMSEKQNIVQMMEGLEEHAKELKGDLI